mmetsp:Transcript_8021/g.30028  ORF Transcript_8021/g.30028 Transcript_8021/m.30028 type:complete len:356 (+) Transcript_8021:1855-2922(+)
MHDGGLRPCERWRQQLDVRHRAGLSRRQGAGSGGELRCVLPIHVRFVRARSTTSETRARRAGTLRGLQSERLAGRGQGRRTAHRGPKPPDPGARELLLQPSAEADGLEAFPVPEAGSDVPPRHHPGGGAILPAAGLLHAPGRSPRLHFQRGDANRATVARESGRGRLRGDGHVLGELSPGPAAAWPREAVVAESGGSHSGERRAHRRTGAAGVGAHRGGRPGPDAPHAASAGAVAEHECPEERQRRASCRAFASAVREHEQRAQQEKCRRQTRRRSGGGRGRGGKRGGRSHVQRGFTADRRRGPPDEDPPGHRAACGEDQGARERDAGAPGGIFQDQPRRGASEEDRRRRRRQRW